MKRHLFRCILAALLLAACGDRDERLESWAGISGPHVVGKRIVYLDHNWEEALILTPAAGNPSPDFERLSVVPEAAAVGIVEEEKALVLRSPTENTIQFLHPETGKSTEYALESPFNRFSLKQDPPYVSAWFSENATGGGTVLFSKGDVAFVDLSKTKDAVRKLTLPTYGGAPLGVDVADRVPAESGSRLFAFVRWNSFVSLVDVENREGKKGGENEAVPVAIPLKSPDSSFTVLPEAMQFVAGNSRLRALFLSQGSPDLYVLDVAVNELKGGGKGVSLNVFPTAPGASRFLPFIDAGNELTILVLCGSARMVAVVRPDSSEVSLYKLDFAPRNVNVFTLPGEKGGDERFAFIYDDSGQSYGYQFVELDRLKEKKSKAFHSYNLPAPVRKVYMLTGDRFLVMHAGGTSPMSQVTVSSGEVISVGGIASLSAEVFTPDMKTMYALGASGNKKLLVRFNTETFAAASIDVTHGSKPNRLYRMAEPGLLVLADGEGDTLVVAPEDFDDPKDAVELLAPVLFGLEHE